MTRIPLVAVICLSVASTACDRTWDESKWTDANFTATKAEGDAIVAALEAYKSQKGTYPATLGALVPEFMVGIPDPSTGWPEWGYVLSEGDRTFELTFAANEGGYPCSYWSSSKGKWIRDE